MGIGMIRGRKVLSKNKISVPDINIPTIDIYKEKTEHPEKFPLIKYIYVAKTFESKVSYKINGIPRRTKCYGIGILTDKNKYYFSELHTRHKELTYYTSDLFKRIFTVCYRYNSKTRILVSDNIKNNKDPLLIFLEIVAAIAGCPIRKQNEFQMLKAINLFYKYIRTSKKSLSLKIWHKNRLIEKLIKLDRFNFITEPNWSEKTDLMVAHVKDAFMECAIGILYMYVRDTDIQRKMKSRENKIRKQLETNNNIV